MKDTIAFILIGIVAFIGVTMIATNNDKARNAKWDTCQTQYEQSGIPREGYQEFIKNCFESK